MPEIFDSGTISIQITKWQLESTQPHFPFQNRTSVSKKHSCIHTLFIKKYANVRTCLTHILIVTFCAAVFNKRYSADIACISYIRWFFKRRDCLS